MKLSVSLLSLSAVVLLRPSMCVAQDVLPTIAGYVVDAGTASFRVEDRTVNCNEGVTVTVLEFTSDQAKTDQMVRTCQTWTIGRQLKVWGKRDKHTGAIAAERIAVDDEMFDTITGFALIDRVLQPESTGSMMIRADGYRLHVTPETKLDTPAPAISSLRSVQPNMWVSYKGRPQVDGSVLVAELLVTPNVIIAKESKLRAKAQFDPAAVKEEDRQNDANKFILGIDSKRIPAHDDQIMQARVNRIGERLVPAYQKALPAGDPTRIDFRFQLVDLKNLPDAIALPSGISQVPYQVADALNDDQLATVIATNIGTVLQKQSLRSLPTVKALAAANITGGAAGLFVPFVGLGTYVGTSRRENAMLRAAREQDQREAMCLLQDAGYDLKEAPMAWWLLHSNPKKTMPNGGMPPAAEYAYHLLGTAWRGAIQ